MNAKTRRKIETGARVLAFSRARPDSSPGYATTLARLEERLARAAALIGLQRDGLAQVRAATSHKRDLRRLVRRSQLPHIARVAQGAAVEAPGLAQKFVLPRHHSPNLEFQAQARAVLAEAQNQKELLVKYGLAETLFDALVKNMAEFDRTVEQSTEARRTHVSASAELDAIGDEIVHLVKVMDTLNRSRFDASPEVIAEWESASNVFGPVHSAEKPDTPVQPDAGDVRPAA